MALTLLPFQKLGASWLSQNQRAMLGDEMGLGKTPQAVTACDLISANRVLVLCPASLKIRWKREFLKWSHRDPKVHIMNGFKAEIDESANVIICNYHILQSEMVRRRLKELRYSAVICDEAHRLKGITSQRTKACLRRGGVVSRAVYKWFLSGTFVPNRPAEMYPILKAVFPEAIHPYVTWETYAKHFCAGGWDGFRITADGYSNLEELSEKLYPYLMRRLKEEVLDQLPPKEYRIIPLDASEEVEQLLAQEFTWHKSELKGGQIEDGEHHATVRRLLGEDKVNAAIKYIEHLLETNQKVGVFAYHRSVVDRLVEGLKHHNPGVVRGGMKDEDKQAMEDRFHDSDSCRVFIGQHQAAGEGIDLTAANRVVFVESSWVPGEIDQAVDRYHRFTQTDKVYVDFLVHDNSMDQVMLKTATKKRDNVKVILGDYENKIIEALTKES